MDQSLFDNLLPLFPLLVPFLLVLFRMIGLFMFVPMFNHTAIPGNVKILLALAITACIFPVVPHQGALPTDLIGLTLAVIGELSVGMLVSILVLGVITGVQMGAHMLSQQMGLSLSSVFDPNFEGQSTAIEQVAFWLATLIFFAIGGHRELINAMVYSYRAVPMGHAVDPALLLNVGVGAMQSACDLAARVGAPGMVAFFLGTLAMGFVGRTMPQLNIMTLGITVNLLLGMVMIAAGMATWAVVTEDAWRGLFATLARLLG
jgi:flagellar biosynthetic protein FliR